MKETQLFPILLFLSPVKSHLSPVFLRRGSTTKATAKTPAPNPQIHSNTPFPQKPQPLQRPKKPITPPKTAPSSEEKISGDESTDQDDKKRKYLYAFGNTTQPRPPRANQDIPVDQDGFVDPQPKPGKKWPDGASTFRNVNKARRLKGHYHRIPLETPMPKGLDVKADGSEVNGPHAETHHTIFPVERMLFLTFCQLFLSLPWRYAGRK